MPRTERGIARRTQAHALHRAAYWRRVYGMATRIRDAALRRNALRHHAAQLANSRAARQWAAAGQ